MDNYRIKMDEKPSNICLYNHLLEEPEVIPLEVKIEEQNLLSSNQV